MLQEGGKTVATGYQLRFVDCLLELCIIMLSHYIYVTVIEHLLLSITQLFWGFLGS